MAADLTRGQRVARDLHGPVQMLGRVIRAEIGAVPPKRAVLHERVLEEHLLAAAMPPVNATRKTKCRASRLARGPAHAF